MESIVSKAAEALIGLGLSGIVILASWSLIAFQFRWIVILQRERFKDNQALQGARIDDLKKIVGDVSGVVEKNTAETRLTGQVVGQVLPGMAQSAQNLQITLSEIREAIREGRLRR